MWCTAPCRTTRSGSGSPVPAAAVNAAGGPVDAVAGVVGEQTQEHLDGLVAAGLEGAKDAQVDVQLGEHRGHRARRQAPQPGPVQHVQHLPAGRGDVPGRHRRHHHLSVRRVAGARCRGRVDGPQPTGVGVHPVEQAAVHGLQVRHVEPTTNPGTVVAAAGTLAHRLPPGGWFSGDRRQGRGAPLTVLNLQVNLRSSRPRVNPAAPRRSAPPPTVHPGAHLTPLA